MFKKVAEAAHLKDRLKRLHHNHAPPTTASSRHGSRYHSSSSKNTAMSFSAVDKDTFEQILDDDTDFITGGKAPAAQHSSAAKGSGAAWLASTSGSAVQSQHSDLFDADIFEDHVTHYDDDELPVATSVGGNSQAEVSYDPLSGQIVSQPVSSSSSDGDSGGVMESGNETEPHHDEDGMGDDGNGIGDNHVIGTSPVQELKLDETEAKSATKSDETEVKLNGREANLAKLDGVEADLDGVESDEAEAENAEVDTEGKALDPELHDYLFDEGPKLAEDTQQLLSSAAEDTVDTLDRDLEPIDSKLQEGIDVPHSCESPVSSVPSSIEADTYWRGSSAREVKHQGHGTEQSNRAEIGSSSQPAVRREMRSHAESSMSDLEAELEQLLAPRSDHALPPRVGVSTGRVYCPQVSAQRGSLPDGEGGSPLDSGVYENEGREINSTPESERTGASVSHNDGGDLSIHDDHFTCSEESSASVPALHAHPLSKTSNQGKKNSSGKTPPPRPPISPRVQKRITKSVNTASLTESTEDRVVVKLVRPLGTARVMNSQAGKLKERSREEGEGVKELSDEEEELFPDDLKKVSEMDELTASSEPIPSTHDSIEQGWPTSQPLDTTTLKGSEADVSEPPREESEFYLSIPFHLLLSLILYLYYSLNIFPYLAGLFAGFLMFYVFLGSVFIYYVQTIEKEREGRLQEKKEAVQVSEDFLQTMKVDFSKLKEYQSNKFTATLKYDAATHHPSQRMPAELSLRDDFKFFVQVVNHESVSMLCNYVDIRICKISIEPTEVAQNRKRRWSKKFPIVISCASGPKRFKVYLFSRTARDKEDWFRRLKSASSGVTSLQLIQKQREFFGYMEKYFPQELLKSPLRPQKFKKQRSSSHQHPSRSTGTHHRMNNTLVQFSKSTEGAESDEMPSSEDPEIGGVNITQKSQSSNKLVSQSRVKGHSSSLSSVDESGFEHVQYPSPLAGRRRTPGCSEGNSNQWLNSLAARLCWDIWHEKRWKDWVKTKIEKKLIRIKTPPFMEQLRLINIDVGNDMPMINQLIGGPRMDLRGIWVYLDVTYRGKFVMTIETKLKLGGGAGGRVKPGEEGKQMTAMSRGKDGSGLPMSSPHSSHHTKSRSLSHTQAAHALAGGGDGSSVDPGEEIDSGSDEEEGSVSHHHHHPLLEEDLANSQELLSQGHASSPATDSTPPSSGHRIKSMVTRVAKKVANTKFVRRAAEKVSNYSLVLTVEVNRLDGVLAVNIPPPPSDTIWWGFHGSPKLELVAKPKVGHREVKLSKVAHWIEKKLCEIVDKKVVLPEMEDLVVPILNSGMDEDKLNLLKPISSSDSDAAMPTT